MLFSFMDQLHEQEFTLLLVDALLNVVWAHLCSCAVPTIGAWFSTCPSTPSFYLSSVHFFTAFIFVLVYHIIYFYIFHDANVVIPLMIWRSIYYVAHVGVSALQPMIRFKIPLQLLHWKVGLTYKYKFLTFSFTTHKNKWILSSPKIIFECQQTLSLSIRLVQISVTCFNHDSACNDNCCSKQARSKENKHREMISFPLP